MDSDAIKAIIDAFTALLHPKAEAERERVKAEIELAKEKARLAQDLQAWSTFNKAGYKTEKISYSGGRITFDATPPAPCQMDQGENELQLEEDLPLAALEAPLEIENNNYETESQKKQYE